MLRLVRFTSSRSRASACSASHLDRVQRRWRGQPLTKVQLRLVASDPATAAWTRTTTGVLRVVFVRHRRAGGWALPIVERTMAPHRPRPPGASASTPSPSAARGGARR